MTPAKIEKIYPKLTPIEQANLAFAAIARQDLDEADIIVGNVPKRDYREKDWYFRQRLSGLTSLASFYGILYWKTRAYMAVAESKYKKTHDPEDQSAVFALLDQLLAMDTALSEVCDKLNIDVASVRKFAQCDHEAMTSEACDPALTEVYTGLLMGIVE